MVWLSHKNQFVSKFHPTIWKAVELHSPTLSCEETSALSSQFCAVILQSACSCMYACTTACNSHCQRLLLQSMEFLSQSWGCSAESWRQIHSHLCVQLALLSVPLATVLWRVITTNPYHCLFPATRSYVHNNMVYCDLRGWIKRFRPFT